MAQDSNTYPSPKGGGGYSGEVAGYDKAQADAGKTGSTKEEHPGQGKPSGIIVGEDGW